MKSNQRFDADKMLAMSTSIELDRYGTQIAARMNAEGALDWSDGEIERCLSGCVGGRKLIPLAKQMRADGMTGQVTPEPYTDDPSVTAFDLAHGDKVTASKTVEAVQPLKPELDDERGHTPGPWKCNLGNGSNLENDTTIWGPNGEDIGQVGDSSRDHWTPLDAANARLIAAAPELLAAAQTLIAGCEAHLAAQGYALQISGMIATRAAIARA